MRCHALYAAQTTVFPRKMVVCLWKVLHADSEVVFITQGPVSTQMLYLADLYNKDTDPHDFRVSAGFWQTPVNNLINLCSFEVTSLAAFVDLLRQERIPSTRGA